MIRLIAIISMCVSLSTAVIAAPSIEFERSIINLGEVCHGVSTAV